MDSRAYNLSLNIFDSIEKNSKKSERRYKLTDEDSVYLMLRLFEQEVESFVPDDCTLSYFSLRESNPDDWTLVMDVLTEAYLTMVPVQLDPGNGYVPNVYHFIADPLAKHKYSTGWKTLPGYGEAAELFPEKPGYKPWFGVFLDAIGSTLFFHYPENPNGIIEIPYEGVDLDGYKIYWKHGIPGLCQYLQVIYFEWLVRNYSWWGK